MPPCARGTERHLVTSSGPGLLVVHRERLQVLDLETDGHQDAGFQIVERGVGEDFVGVAQQVSDHLHVIFGCDNHALGTGEPR